MKALKITGAVLIAITLVFFSIGLIVPSYEYQTSIEVNASPEKCWSTFNNTKLMSQWIPGLESFELKSGDTLAPGSLYEMVITDDGHRMLMNERIVEVNAPIKISYDLTNEVLKSEYTFSFEGTSSTKITSQYKVTGKNMIWRSILFLSKSYMVNSANDQLTLLKKVVEAQP